MRARSLLSVVSIGLAVAIVARPAAQAPRAAAPYTVLSAEGRGTVSAVTVGDQEMLRLDELATLLQLTVREDRAAKALTVSRGTNIVVLSLDQGLASIGGRILSLTAAPARDGPRWLVPPDTVSRALAPIAGVRTEVRRASRLIVLGDLRVPRVTVQQEPGGPPTRIAIEITPRAAYTIVQEPRRLLVRFDADALDVGAMTAGGGLVESVTSADSTTLAIALHRNFGTFRAATMPVDAAASRILIDIMAAGAPASAPSGLGRAQPPPAPITPPPAAMAKPETAPALPAAQPPGIRTVVIDPGHGGDEQGTRGASGVLEKDLVLDVARRLRTVLDARLGIRVLLTRDDDRIVPHDERASIANNNKADLFISLHANSSPSLSARGAEVFYLSLDGLGAEARRMVESPETRPVPVLGGGSRDIDLILWDMAQARHLNESAAFALLVEEELRRRVEMSPNPIQQAPFRVLIAANMPAVLVEMGFLSNPEQEAQLTSDDFKNRVVQALVDAVVRYRGRIEGQAAGRRP
ncbi:MAG: N-acetylmuramoyl-L-alanine amidase [Vicinamibacterales bacterium]